MAAYFRAGRKQLDATHKDVIALSSVLNRLGVHDGHKRGEQFRNPNGVAMKLGNFSAIDPNHSGVGLARGGKLEKAIWKEYASDVDRLYTTADAIQALGAPGVVREPIRGWDEEGEEEEFPEGRLLTRLHIARERNAQACRRKKQSVLKETGRLSCECCSFDFVKAYGDLGREFAECHHRTPLAELKEGTRTKLVDLSIVCSNCHRMLHRTGNVLSVEDLRLLVDARRKSGA